MYTKAVRVRKTNKSSLKLPMRNAHANIIFEVHIPDDNNNKYFQQCQINKINDAKCKTDAL